MATETVDSHQTFTSDEQTAKLSSEAVKAAEQINISSPRQSAEDDREKGKADKLHTPEPILSTSEEKAEDIQAEPPVIEVKKTDETPVEDSPVHDNVKLEKESIPDCLTTTVAEAVPAIVENHQKEHPLTSTESVGEEATEPPVIASVEKSVEENFKIVDTTNNVKSSPEERPTAEFIAREALEAPATVSAERVQEPIPEAADVPKLEVKSLDDTVDNQAKEQPAVAEQSVIGVPEKLEILPVPEEQVEEKKPQIIDNPELSVDPTADSGKGPAKEQPDTCVSELSVEPPKKEEQQTDILQVKEPVEVIAKEILETVEPPTEEKQLVEVHPVKGSGEVMAKEISEPIEPPEEKDRASEVHPVQESREVIAKNISEEVHPEKELAVVAQESSESIESPKNKEQPDEVLLMKEKSEVKAKEISASSEPPRNKEQPGEGSPVTESGEVKGKQTSGFALAFEEVEKQEPEVIKVKDGIGELPQITNQVQSNYVEVETEAIVKGETMKDEEALAPRDNIIPAFGRQIHEEDAPHAVKCDKQDSVGQVAQPGSTADSGKGPAKEQPDREFVSVEKEPKEEPETTRVAELSVESPKKEEQPIEVIPVNESVEVIAKGIIKTVEASMEKEQPTEVHQVEGSGEVMAKEITDLIELPKDKEQATEIHPVQESREVIAEKISGSVEIPKEKELLIEVHPVKELAGIAKETSESIEPPKSKEQLDVIPKKESGEVIGKDISASFEPPKNKEQTDEGFPVTESGEVKGKETRGSTLMSVEGEKQEPEVIEEKDGIGELPEINNQVQNNCVEVEATVKDEKALAFRDDISPPLGGVQIHKGNEQFKVGNEEQDSIGQVAQSNVELAGRDFSMDVEEKTSKGDEKKESSNIDVVAESSKVEVKAVENVGEENEEKILETNKIQEDKYEKIQESGLSTEEEAAKGSEIAVIVAEKSIDDKKTDEEVELIAETKIDESIKDEKPGLIETGNVEHVEGKFNVNEAPKEFQESEVQVKDRETVITGVEIPTSNVQNKEPSKREGDEIKLSQNLQKEVPSKPIQKHSHNILSKVKQSLVKAKKAIIGKSPSSKTLSSEARDDIKVK